MTVLSSFSPLRSAIGTKPLLRANTPVIGEQVEQPTSLLSVLLGISQKRWKSRGNTYQPSTLKRKRRVGFLARAKDKQGSKILKRRREKGRWYLTH